MIIPSPLPQHGTVWHAQAYFVSWYAFISHFKIRMYRYVYWTVLAMWLWSRKVSFHLSICGTWVQVSEIMLRFFWNENHKTVSDQFTCVFQRTLREEHNKHYDTERALQCHTVLVQWVRRINVSQFTCFFNIGEILLSPLVTESMSVRLKPQS